MEDERPYPPPSSFSIFIVLRASAPELTDREGYASMCKGTRLLTNLEECYLSYPVDPYRQ